MCFEKRKTPACCIAVMSGIAIIMGALMIVFAAMLTNSDLLDQFGKENEEVQEGVDAVFLGLLIFALATIGISFLGFFLVCCKNRCITVTYGCLLFPAWIVLIVIGGAALSIAIFGKEEIEKECENITEALTTSVNLDDITGEAAADAAADAATQAIIDAAAEQCPETTDIELSLDIYKSIKIE